MLTEVLVAVIVAAPPSAMASLAWAQSRKNQDALATGNGKHIGAYALQLDQKLDALDGKVDALAVQALAHDERDRQAFRAAGLPYPDAS